MILPKTQRRFFAATLFFASLLNVLLANSVSAADSLTIFPEKFTLTGQAARQQLIVEQFQDRFGTQITNAIFETSNPGVVKIENGIALPLTNGVTKITAKFNGKTAVAEVTVAGTEKEFAWSFRNHVQPVLAKAGCSSGACHGAAAGQNGFKLSLRGYDDEGDFLALTHGAFSRRVIPSDPGRSLILLKPTTAVPHKGGKRFEIDDDAAFNCFRIVIGLHGDAVKCYIPPRTFSGDAASQRILVSELFYLRLPRNDKRCHRKNKHKKMPDRFHSLHLKLRI